MKATNILKPLKAREMEVGSVFSGHASGIKVMGYETPCVFTPKINPNHVFHEAGRDVIVWLIAPLRRSMSAVFADQGNQAVSASWPQGSTIPSLRSQGTTVSNFRIWPASHRPGQQMASFWGVGSHEGTPFGKRRNALGMPAT